MNIDNFKSIVSNNPLLDPARYTVQVSGPQGVLKEDFSAFCSSVDLPGRGLGTAERYTHGPIRKVAYSELYDDVTTTFYATQDMGIRDFFDEWQTFIGGDDFYIQYYKAYIGTVIIYVEDKENNNVASYELFEAYPIAISPITLSYDQMNVVPVFTVTWAYHHFEKKKKAALTSTNQIPVKKDGHGNIRGL